MKFKDIQPMEQGRSMITRPTVGYEAYYSLVLSDKRTQVDIRSIAPNQNTIRQVGVNKCVIKIQSRFER